MLIQRDHSALLIVDVQEKLAPVMTDPRRVIHNCSLLLRAAQRLEVPALVSEQYPKGIGPTVVDLREWCPEGGVVEKTHFSCAAEPGMLARIKDLHRRQIVVAGIEHHICVLQTAIGLKSLGYDVFVVADACASRKAESEALARSRLRQEDVVLVSVEMVLFEWLHKAGTPEFKELSALIR
ncbi:MAG TPA: hydrolase [Candidatus Sulfotelmatobacter sp.]|nr:hydrolase [Candidatus Sulfotelmatobacter sp.]